MTIIYLHGLDANPNATKALITAKHANTIGIATLRPDLNYPPGEVMTQLLALIDDNPDCVLIGSSLGGYFATLLSDMTGTPAILLNPSIRPDLSFRRFLKDRFEGQSLSDETVIYTTTGNWQIKFKDLAWFEAHRLTIKHPSQLRVLLNLGDELLDAYATQTFYQNAGVHVLSQAGGDHRMSNYPDRIDTVLSWVKSLQNTA